MTHLSKHPSRRLLLTLPLVAVALVMLFDRCRPAARRGLTSADVARIQSIVAKEEPSHYRLVLPEFRDGRAVGSQVVGAMPIDQVELIARRQNVTIRPNAQLHVVLAGPLRSDDGGAGGGGGGNGPNSHYTTSTARFKDLEEIVSRLDRQLNQLIVE
jgi:hypothetical protein